MNWILKYFCDLIRTIKRKIRQYRLKSALEKGNTKFLRNRFKKYSTVSDNDKAAEIAFHLIRSQTNLVSERLKKESLLWLEKNNVRS